MAKKPTRIDYKKKADRLKKELETIQKKREDLDAKEAETKVLLKEAEAEYVLQLLKETDTPVSLLEDLLVTDEKEGDI